MSSKLDHIPHLNSYDDIRAEMAADLEYRLATRTQRTSLGRPLYRRMNVQVVMTHECPYNCPFCIERQNPMTGEQDFDDQLFSLGLVLSEHPDARLTITGGEPGLYPPIVKRLAKRYSDMSNKVFCSINTTGISTRIKRLGHINLSYNDYVQPDPKRFPHCTLQTVVESPTLQYIKSFMDTMGAESYSFRFVSEFEKRDYPVDVWNDLEEDPEVNIHTFRIGDFFVYATFDYNGKHARLTLGDMWQQQHNDYKDGYSNIIIHPDGRIGLNWR